MTSINTRLPVAKVTMKLLRVPANQAGSATVTQSDFIHCLNARKVHVLIGSSNTPATLPTLQAQLSRSPQTAGFSAASNWGTGTFSFQTLAPTMVAAAFPLGGQSQVIWQAASSTTTVTPITLPFFRLQTTTGALAGDNLDDYWVKAYGVWGAEFSGQSVSTPEYSGVMGSFTVDGCSITTGGLLTSTSGVHRDFPVGTQIFGHANLDGGANAGATFITTRTLAIPPGTPDESILVTPVPTGAITNATLHFVI